MKTRNIKNINCRCYNHHTNQDTFVSMSNLGPQNLLALMLWYKPSRKLARNLNPKLMEISIMSQGAKKRVISQVPFLLLRFSTTTNTCSPSIMIVLSSVFLIAFLWWFLHHFVNRRVPQMDSNGAISTRRFGSLKWYYQRLAAQKWNPCSLEKPNLNKRIQLRSSSKVRFLFLWSICIYIDR
jgi:hypothetical protein